MSIITDCVCTAHMKHNVRNQEIREHFYIHCNNLLILEPMLKTHIYMLLFSITHF